MFSPSIAVDSAWPQANKYIEKEMYVKHTDEDQSKMLHTLCIRGRHNMTSPITPTQRFSALHHMIRATATELFVYRLRSLKDLDTFIDKVSAMVDNSNLMKLYHAATSAPYSCLDVELPTTDTYEMFCHRFDKRLVIQDEI